jgi:hypothetical protein
MRVFRLVLVVLLCSLTSSLSLNCAHARATELVCIRGERECECALPLFSIANFPTCLHLLLEGMPP